MPEPQPRRLEDFKPLTAAEQKVLDELDTGDATIISGGVPEADAGSEVLIRSRFLRCLVLRNFSAEHETHEKGLMVFGALITGEGPSRERHAALDLQGVSVPQDILLMECRLTAVPNFLGARLHGLYLNGTHLPGIRGDGLVSVASVFLRDVRCFGEICLRGARIGGDLDCDGASVCNPGGYALSADNARISDAFVWRKNASSDGTIDLSSTEIGHINDDPRCWPNAGELALDRCLYGAFTGLGISAKERLRWLALQEESRWGKEFWPQPYEQCAKVLREMGHQDDAREILVEKERLLRKARRAKLTGPKLWWHSFWDTFLAWTVSYGQKPFQAGYWLALLWLLGTVSFWTLHAHDQFKPNNAFVLRAPEWANCSPEHAPSHKYLGEAGQSQLACFEDRSEAKGLPEFNPLVYSLDVLFPLVQLEQQVHWIPDDDQPLGAWGKALVYVQIVMGWLLSLLAVAGLSGIIKSD